MRPKKVCPACRVIKHMTLHHILPVRWFGRKGNHQYFFLCHDCHKELEQRIPYKLIPERQYFIILIEFLQEVNHGSRHQMRPVLQTATV